MWYNFFEDSLPINKVGKAIDEIINRGEKND